LSLAAIKAASERGPPSEAATVALVKQQVKPMEAERRQQLAEGEQPLVAQLARLRAIGPMGGLGIGEGGVRLATVCQSA